MRTILDAFAEYERAMIRARTRLAMLAKARRREYTGGAAPYGWRAQGGKVEAEGDEQTVIGMIRQLSREGRGAAAIATRLNVAGVPCRGSEWHARSVARILAREKGAA